MNRILFKIGQYFGFIVVGVVVVVKSYAYYTYRTSWDYQVDRANMIYHKLLVQTGQLQDALPLVISTTPVLNAQNDGVRITIFAKMLSFTNDDQLALVLGHEIAHGMLGHLPIVQMGATDVQISVLEGNADKMGAVYAIKAGYSVCRGRTIFKIWRGEFGNSLGENHPDYSYRYDELNLHCE